MREAITFQEFLRLRRQWPVDCFFEPEELLFSEEALAHDQDNLPTPAEWEMIKRFGTKVARPVRLIWNAPLIITSGFRDEEVNRLAGGEETSDHRFQIGGACDLRPLDPSDAAVRALFHAIAENTLDKNADPSFDQLILYPFSPQGRARVHIGWRPTGNRKELRRAVRVKKPDGTFEWSWPLVDWEEWKKDLRLET